MAKGIIYIMTTSVKGLIKIGKTDNFKSRMAKLEQDGYWNVSGLHPFFAVKVDDYDKKEKLIHTMFSKSQVANSELFAIDKHIAKELLESFGGEQVFPEVGKVVKELDTTLTRAERMTFEMLGIPVGSELVYTVDDSIKCITVDKKNRVKYNNKTYTLSGLVVFLKNGGRWQGGEYFTYKGKKLTDIRREKGL